MVVGTGPAAVALGIARTPAKLGDGVGGPVAASAGHFGARRGLAKTIATIRWHRARVWRAAAILPLGFSRTPARFMTYYIVGKLVITGGNASQRHVSLNTAQGTAHDLYLRHR